MSLNALHYANSLSASDRAALAQLIQFSEQIAALRTRQQKRAALQQPLSRAAYPSSATIMELLSKKPRSVSAMRSSSARSNPAFCSGSARSSRAA